MSDTRHYRADGTLAIARKYNLFTRSPRGGKILSALTRPLFELLRPRGFGVITTTGRKTGKRRHKCIRAIVEEDRAYVVMIRPYAPAKTAAWVAAWVLNIRADPNVRLRIHGGRYAGIARELFDPAELAAAKSAYVASVNLFDYSECRFHRTGLPTKAKIQELHATWFETGIPLVIELDYKLASFSSPGSSSKKIASPTALSGARGAEQRADGLAGAGHLVSGFHLDQRCL